MIDKVFKGRYRLLSKLGIGVSSTVYEAEDLQTNQRVAIKVLKPELNHNPTFVQRFRRETRATQGINNPHVVKVLDWDEQDETNFIVLELVRGKTLRLILDETPRLNIIRALRYTVQILEGAAEAHKVGIVHRDLKPANIMITDSEVVKVMDFGIAKDAALTSITNDGSVIGTPYYMSPEQVKGQYVDGRADIYAIGAILYEMLSGHPPFEADSAYGIITQHIEMKPAPLPLVNPNIPMLLDAMVQKALAKRPEERYQNANEMAYALRLYPGVIGEASTTTDGPTTPVPLVYAPFPPAPGSVNPPPPQQQLPYVHPQLGAQPPNQPYPGAQSPYPNQGYQPNVPPTAAQPVTPPPSVSPTQPYQQGQRPGAYAPPPNPVTSQPAGVPTQPVIPIVPPVAQSPNTPPPTQAWQAPPQPTQPYSPIPGQRPGQSFYPGQQPGAQSPVPPYAPPPGRNQAGASSPVPPYQISPNTPTPNTPPPVDNKRRGGFIWVLAGLIFLLVAGVVAIIFVILNSGSTTVTTSNTTEVKVPTNTGVPSSVATTQAITSTATDTTVATTTAALSTATPSPVPSPTIDVDNTNFLSATDAIAKQDWKRAIALLEPLAAKNYKPQEVKAQLTTAYCSYGKDLAKNGDPSESVVNLENCLKLDPNNADSKPAYDRIKLYREGTIFAGQKNWPAALPPLENLYSQDKNFRDVGPILFDAYRQYLAILTDSKNYADGLAICDKAKKIDAGVDPSVIDPDCRKVLQLTFTPTPVPPTKTAAPPTPTPRSCFSNFFAYNVGQPSVPNVADQGASSVTGVVINRSKIAIGGATVRVSSGGFSFTTSTNGNGRYQINGLGKGSWNVVVIAAPGYSICTSLSAAVTLSGQPGFIASADFVESEP